VAAAVAEPIVLVLGEQVDPEVVVQEANHQEHHHHPVQLAAQEGPMVLIQLDLVVVVALWEVQVPHMDQAAKVVPES
jgi:hypothetical protein